MKKRQLIWIGLIGVIMASCGGKYKITGKTNLIPDGETILLQKQNNEQFEIVDSATVTNGSFSFKGEQKSPTIAILVHLNDKQSQIPPQLIALEKGDIYVTLDSVSHISGTPLNDRLQMYETKRRSYDTRIRNITNRYLKDYLSGQLSDSTFVILKKAFDKEQKGLETLTRNYILANTDNVTSIYLFLQNSFLFSPEEQRELIAHAAPSFKKNPAVKKSFPHVGSTEKRRTRYAVYRLTFTDNRRERDFFIDIYRQREIYSPRLLGIMVSPLSKTNSLFKTIIRTI